MSEILKVKKENVINAAKTCGEFKEALKILFPSVFEEAPADMLKEINKHVDFDGDTVYSGLRSLAESDEVYVGNDNIRVRGYDGGRLRVHVPKSAAEVKKLGEQTYAQIIISTAFAGRLMNKLSIKKSGGSLGTTHLCGHLFYDCEEFFARRDGETIILVIKLFKVRERENYLAFEVWKDTISSLFNKFSC